MWMWERIRDRIIDFLIPRDTDPSSPVIRDECLDLLHSPELNEKRIIVFVSSPFLDMGAERDQLALYVFPELKRICEDRGIIWGEVDLRWGIPPDREVQTVEICLRLIDRCRPYFIGILGERYGRTALPISPLLEREFPWLKTDQERSITEIEILHGALNRPEEAKGAFFYFRDPAYIETLPENIRDSFRDFPTEEGRPQHGEVQAERRSAERRERLASLKKRIFAAGLPVRENYHNPEEFGQLVRADLLNVINLLSAPPMRTDSRTDYDTLWLNSEARSHNEFARSRFGIYVTRKEYFDEINSHVSAAGPPIVITGASGLGKSALLAHWTDHYLVAHPRAIVIYHFVGATSDSADLTMMLRRLIGELRRQLGIKKEIPRDVITLRAAFPQWLAMASRKGPVVLVIDALNRLVNQFGALDLTWLPSNIPANVRVVVSTLPGRSLDIIVERGWPILEITPLTIDERKKLIFCYLRHFYRELPSTDINEIASVDQMSSPLFIRAVLEELRVCGEHNRLTDQIKKYLAIPTIPALFEAILARYERHYELERRGLIRGLCTAIWASRRGLSINELRELLGENGLPLPYAYWAPLQLAMQQALIEKGDVLTFSHDYFRAAVKARYLKEKSAIAAAHLKLADYFEGTAPDIRRIEELPWQLAMAGAWSQLVVLLSDPMFFSAAFVNREYDVLRYWTAIEKSSSFRVVEAYEDVMDNPRFDNVGRNCVALLLNSMGYPAKAGAIWEQMAASTSDLDLRRAMLGNQALTLNALGNPDGAMALHKEEEEICRKLGNLEGLQRSLGNQAVIHFARGDLAKAMALHKKEERFCRKLGDRESLQFSLGNQANILKAWGYLDDAMALHKEEELICRDLGISDSLQRSLGNQANILIIRGDRDGALKLFEEQEDICHEIGNQDGLQVSLGNQAGIAAIRDDPDKALRLYIEQERICTEIRSLEGLQGSLGNQAVILADRGDLEGALALHKREENLCRHIQNVKALAESLCNQALILAKQDRLVEARHASDEAYDLALKGPYVDLIQYILEIKKRFGF